MTIFQEGHAEALKVYNKFGKSSGTPAWVLASASLYLGDVEQLCDKPNDAKRHYSEAASLFDAIKDKKYAELANMALSSVEL
jgi:hypothetical protein